MEIVIDIPKYIYEHAKEQSEDSNDEWDAMRAIANGILLPEHHGRLIDADELYSIFKENCNAYNIDNLSFISDMDMNFDLAPTIIEAE